MLLLLRFLRYVPFSSGAPSNGLHPVSAEVAAAIFSLLTAAVFALQVVLRAPFSQSDLPLELGFGRRDLLTRIAYKVLVVCEMWTSLIVASLFAESSDLTLAEAIGTIV
jgi:hypothetical protein